MPVEIAWIEENRFLKYRAQGSLTPDDLRQMVEAEVRFYVAKPYGVHTLLDASRLISVPNDLPALLAPSQLVGFSRGHVAIVPGADSAWLAGFSPRRTLSVHLSYEDALRRLYTALYARQPLFHQPDLPQPSFRRPSH